LKRKKKKGKKSNRTMKASGVLVRVLQRSSAIILPRVTAVSVSTAIGGRALGSLKTSGGSAGGESAWGKEGTGKWGLWGASAVAALFGGGLAVASYSPYGAGLVVNCEAYDADEVVDISNLQKFDRNWDGRQPKEDEQEPTAYRYIILVRHGQYNTKAKSDAEASLTAAGRQQAQVLAQKIVDTYNPTKVIRSDMTRAVETFNILMKRLPPDTPTSVIHGMLYFVCMKKSIACFHICCRCVYHTR
jgi:hypothetical protein